MTLKSGGEALLKLAPPIDQENLAMASSCHR